MPGENWKTKVNQLQPASTWFNVEMYERTPPRSGTSKPFRVWSSPRHHHATLSLQPQLLVPLVPLVPITLGLPAARDYQMYQVTTTVKGATTILKLNNPALVFFCFLLADRPDIVGKSNKRNTTDRCEPAVVTTKAQCNCSTSHHSKRNDLRS